MNKMKFPASAKTSVRTKLLRDLLGIITLTSGVITAVAFFQFSHQTRDISQSVIEQATESARNELVQFFQPLEKSLLMAGEWGRSGLLDLSDVTKLNAKFVPFLEQMLQVSSVVIAQENGREYFLIRDGKNWLDPFN